MAKNIKGAVSHPEDNAKTHAGTTRQKDTRHVRTYPLVC
jgi:hypothetical protein